MKIVVFADNVDVNDDLIDKSDVVITVDEDRKGFQINRHVVICPNSRLFLNAVHGGHRHMSELKHILLAKKLWMIKWYMQMSLD